MDNWYIIISSAICSIGLIIRTLVKEKEKRKRIKQFEKMDNSKINAIGNYEKRSNFWNDLKRRNQKS
ncbi:hypothetical protein [Psychroserpens sp. AS72]|uniref:hypothetical protein n=1 Tax=Psychroserpens sp. AS72 TaxID=3135775 RepID=UPI00319E6C2F